MKTFHSLLHNDLFKGCLRFYNGASPQWRPEEKWPFSQTDLLKKAMSFISDEEQPYDTFEEIRFAESRKVKNVSHKDPFYPAPWHGNEEKERYLHNCALNLLSSQGGKCKVLREKGELGKVSWFTLKKILEYYIQDFEKFMKIVNDLQKTPEEIIEMFGLKEIYLKDKTQKSIENELFYQRYSGVSDMSHYYNDRIIWEIAQCADGDKLIENHCINDSGEYWSEKILSELSDEDLGKNIEEYICSDDDSEDESWKEMFPDGMNSDEEFEWATWKEKRTKEKRQKRWEEKKKIREEMKKKEEAQKEIENRSSKMRQNLINSIIEEFSNVDPKTGDIPELSDLWEKIEKIYEEDKKMIMQVMEKKKRDEIINKFPEEMRKKSIANYADYYGLHVENVSICDVFYTSASIRGWANEYGN